MRRAARTVLVTLSLSLVVPTTVAGATTTEDNTALGSDTERSVRDDRSRGVVYDGLRLGIKGSECEGMFQIDGLTGPGSCTHGPDPSPFGVDVGRDAPLVNPRERARAPQIWCDPESGTEGARVQAVYAVASDQPDRYDEVLPSIRTWAGEVEQTFAASAEAHGGGERHVRWVTGASCQLDVLKVVVSPDGDGDFSATIADLKAQGHLVKDRKYLIWMDANKFCGIGNMYNDDRPDETNYNNGAFAMYARVDTGCWGLDPSVEAHELMHNLGGVQNSAPNANGTGHCNDDADRMCYSEGGQNTTARCDNSWEALFDCGGDDYFNPSPKPGSYLAGHWNAANSRFLTSEPGVRVEDPASTERQLRRTGRLTARQSIQRRTLTVADGPVTLTVQGTVNSGRRWRLVVRDADGNVVDRDAGSRRATVRVSPAEAGRYTIVISNGRGSYVLKGTYHA
jgi:hypothetical protein